MEESVILIVLIAVVVGILSVIVGIALVRFWDRYQKKSIDHRHSRCGDVVFLFDNKKMVDTTRSGHQLLAGVSTPQDEWHRLMSWLGPHFSGAVEKIKNLGEKERISLTGKSRLGAEKLHLLVEDLGKGMVRIILSAKEELGSFRSTDGASKQVMEEELQFLREAAEKTPALVWREDAAGQIVWANTTYLKYVGIVHDGVISWPLPHLLSPPKSSAKVEICRDKFTIHGKTIWFDCYEHDIEDQKIFYALPADAAVRAERNLRDFVQTLTKTFANLQIGLAIFDRQRNLQLFNPPLIDLTNLSVEFLVTRPTLADFLDQLREQRMVPEPKDFRVWQKQIINLEKSASSGHHMEEWSLPSGQTYRVTGCPHPDGAIAFMFEDITTEMVKTRELHEALILNKQILDELNEGVIVFSQTDQLLLANETYMKLWGEPGPYRSDALAHWAREISSEDLAKLKDAMQAVITGKRSQGKVILKNGDQIRWLIFQIYGGQSVVCFDPRIEQEQKAFNLSASESAISN